MLFHRLVVFIKNNNTAVPRTTRRRRLGRDFLAASPHIRARASMVAFGSSSDTGRAPRRAPRGVASPGAAPPSSSGKSALAPVVAPPRGGKENDARAPPPPRPAARRNQRARRRGAPRDASRRGAAPPPSRETRRDDALPRCHPPPGATPVKNLLFEGDRKRTGQRARREPPPPRGLSRPLALPATPGRRPTRRR